MKITVIGFGHMGSAIVEGAVKTGVLKKEDITVSDKLEALVKSAEALGVRTVSECREAVKGADIVILAVRPADLADTCAQIKENLGNAAVVSICAGKKIKTIEDLLGGGKIIRVMPNTPALVGEGMSAICKNSGCDDKTVSEVLEIFRSFGNAEITPEELSDAVTAVSGSGPAYVYSFIIGLRDYAISAGMSEETATEFAAQTVLGSAKMVIESGTPVDQLKRNICTPNGTTVEAVKVLDERGFEGIISDAAKACEKRSRELGK